MSRHVVSILVDNQSGVLSRVTGLFSRRGYNIDSLSVGETENPGLSRITVVIAGDDYIINQIEKQLEKLVDVRRVIRLSDDNSVYRELALIKVSSAADKRPEIVAIANVFRANIIDVSPASVTIELTGDQQKISAFCELLQPYGIMEIARTGLTGLQRGKDFISELD